MRITKESDFDGGAALALRHRLNLSQKNFWAVVHVGAPRGSTYENGKWKVPPTVQRLLFLHYIVGIPVDSTDMESLKKIAEAARRSLQIKSAAADIEKASQLLTQAKVKLNAPAKQ